MRACHGDFAMWALTRAPEATYDVCRVGERWRVRFGSFAWDFDTWPAACEHALECARLYATVSGRCTAVCVPGSNGARLEVRRFAGVVRLPVDSRWLKSPGERRA
jgi:hypothetical protein